MVGKGVLVCCMTSLCKWTIVARCCCFDVLVLAITVCDSLFHHFGLHTLERWSNFFAKCRGTQRRTKKKEKRKRQKKAFGSSVQIAVNALVMQWSSRELGIHVCKSFSVTSGTTKTINVPTESSFHCGSDRPKSSAKARDVEQKLCPWWEVMPEAPWGKKWPFFVCRGALKLVLSRLDSFVPRLSQRRSSRAVVSFHGNAAYGANSRVSRNSSMDHYTGRSWFVGQFRKLATKSSLLRFLQTNYQPLDSYKTFFNNTLFVAIGQKMTSGESRKATILAIVQNGTMQAQRVNNSYLEHPHLWHQSRILLLRWVCCFSFCHTSQYSMLIAVTFGLV